MRDQRKHPRFSLKLPFELIRKGSEPVQQTGETRNLSSSGVFFAADAEFTVGEPIEFVITLPAGTDGSQVKLRCMGKVVRVEESSSREGTSTGIAATVERFEFVRAKSAGSRG